MSEGFSLIDLKGLSETANKLIEKISDGICGGLRPWQIKRVAQANAHAKKLDASTDIEIMEFKGRALQRFICEQERNQNNIETITLQALNQLESTAKPEEMERDWITYFFEQCRIVSDSEMQALWAKLLASEANNPGSFSKRTVNLVGLLDKKDAQLFTKLSSFNWKIGKLQPLILDVDAEIYTKEGINFETLEHLETLGLIMFNNLTGYVRRGFSKRTIVSFQNKHFIIEFPKEANNSLEIGKVRLTSIGMELGKICCPDEMLSFDDYVINHWLQEGIKISALSSQNIVVNG